MGAVAEKEVKLLRERGVQAWLACPKVPGREKQEHIIELRTLGFGNGGFMLGLLEPLKNADIVHLHYPFFGTAEMVAFYKYLKLVKRLVITLHMDAKGDGWRKIAFGLQRAVLQPKILSAADQLFVSSMDYALGSSYKAFASANPEKIIELPFGVDADYFSPGAVDLQKFQIPEGSFVIGSVSVQDKAHEFKGIDLLINSIKELPSNTHLLLVGSGNLQPNYRALAKNLGLESRVHFAGKLNKTDLLAAYRAMNIFAFPSTSGAEAFGLAMLEAMSCGVPVAASDLPGVRALAESAGLIVPPNDPAALAKAFNTLINEPSQLKNYSAEARAKALRYNWSDHITELVKNYQALCA